MAQCSTEYFSFDNKPMLNVFTKSIIASSAYVSTYMLLCLLYPIVQGEGRVAIAINAMHELY